ncbi:MAG: tRNA (adenosine(37)-N6)-threonylcarbamoyltransferase complex dimerization subunit type 1 TsaB [candidate division WOR-3 bacterium]
MTELHLPGRFLGIETSGTTTAVAVVSETEVLAETAETGTAHNEILFRLIARIFEVTGTRPAGLAGIGVTTGPGMFTSLRVGLSAAKALALAHGTPLAGIDTFAALAASVGAIDPPVLTVVDARKQQVYAALFRGTARVFGPLLATSAELAARVAAATRRGDRLVVAGSGSGLCMPSLLTANLAATDSGVGVPSAAVVGRLARTRIADCCSDDVGRLEPLYLRRTDAELSRKTEATGRDSA